MPFRLQPQLMPATSGEEKNALIRRELVLVRRRINLLALQSLVFEAAALTIGAGAGILICAFKLGSGAFAIALALIAAGGLTGLFLTIRKALRERVTTYQAARVADQRACLKGRLATLHAMREGDRNSALMPYLIEDTMSLREEFAVGRIEPRRISRSVGWLAAACAISAAALVFISWPSANSIAAKGEPTEITVPLEDLDVRPAEPGADADTVVTADPETMAKLAEKAAEAAANGPDGPLRGLAGKAQSLAGELQDKLTGRKQSEGARIKLRLAQALEDQRPQGAESPDLKKARKRNAQDGAGGIFDKRESTAKTGPLPPIDPEQPDQQNDETAGGASGLKANESTASNDSDQHDNVDAVPNDNSVDSGSGSAAHGAGSDPEHLFGRASIPPLSAESFEIMIAARPTQNGSPDESRSYLPPRIRAALNPEQHSDEPIARSQIPAQDRDTIKKVFER
jgi:hypothetical protein